MTKKTKAQSVVEVIDQIEQKGLSEHQYIMQLEKDNIKLAEGLTQATDRLIELQEEIVNLKSMLFSQNSNITGIVAPMSDEELIADLQMRILTEKAKKGALSLEDIKIYDLLVKNKKLARENDIPSKNKEPAKQLGVTKLVEIASSKQSEEK